MAEAGTIPARLLRRGIEWPRLAPKGFRLAVFWLLSALTLGFLCVWGLGIAGRPVDTAFAQAPILVAGLEPAAAIVPTEDGGALSLASGHTLRIRGHAGPIVEAAVIDGGGVLLTTDAYGGTRQTPLPFQPAFAMLEPGEALARLDANLLMPLRTWTGASLPAPLQQNALWAALATALLALISFAAPQALAFAGRLRPKLSEGPSAAATPKAFQPARMPGAVWRQPIPGLPDKAASEMVTVPPGRFLMGAPEGEQGASSDEFPQHEVTIGYAFALGKNPVTFAEWDAAIAAGAKLPKPYDQGWGRGARPVINVSWEDAQAYLAWLNDTVDLADRPDAYRLPSEAEWEYACRAGSSTRWSFGDDERRLGDYAWFAANSGAKTHPVGQKLPNGFGLHDMHGNVHEWCEDSFQISYEGAPADGSVWTGEESSSRVIRGGGWFNVAQGLRSALRIRFAPTFRDDNLGFRVARTL